MSRSITRGRLTFAIFALFIFLHFIHFFDGPLEGKNVETKEDLESSTVGANNAGINNFDIYDASASNAKMKEEAAMGQKGQTPPLKDNAAKSPFVSDSADRYDAVKKNLNEIQSVYDFIVVGGGESGLVVGNRLSENSMNTVLVVEYGYLYHDDPKIARPFQPFDLAKGEFHDPKLMYNFSSTPQAALRDRRTPVSSASTVGGGSTVNGMFLNRGAADDYNSWEKLGNPGWGWKDLLPYFKKSVTFTPPGNWLQQEYGATFDEGAAYGKNGPIHASNPAWAWPASKHQIAGWKELGVSQSKEGAGGEAFGLFWVPRAQDPVSQTRSYSVTGHLDPAMKRKNFELLTGHAVKKVILSDDGVAQSVQIQIRNGAETSIVKARKEIIMCAGLMTPIILQRSGIGPKKILNNAGIEVLVDLPGVGMNLQDHPASGLSYTFQTDLPLHPGMLYGNASFTAQAQAEYVTNKTGPFIGGHNQVAFLPGNNFLQDPLRLVSSIKSQNIDAYLPASYNGDKTLLAGYAAQKELITEAITSPKSTLMEIPVAADPYVLMILQKPLSRGTITIDPADPMSEEPLLDYQTLMNPVDIEVMVDMVRFARKWATTKAMKRLSPREDWPGLDVQADWEIMDHIRSMTESSIGHASGTCAMMPRGKGGVVGPDLLVHGVPGLSVADSSMMPLIPSTNLCATVYAVAEKAADMIKRRHAGKMSVEN